ncbi:geranylgeranyl diphosphate synthase type I [Geodermatophilus bullaregiensis]|uniref:polyprenyl synthetase family protein n=1 Tax=Geodermatophilus bullaregiensis TaxID=1564160 RepID=UPI001956FF55|nr:polyprenyl synthetase family protein [Geodermatophilus bullaregiensis]MBM7808056.1 geranylgeranyl diphosphate synthase type I [Geodermatophilus bullaregiensis]
MEYAAERPGKMIRGEMLLNACLAVGGDAVAVEWAAVGAECGHLASLVHDDIMDHDVMRRGQPTIWSKYGFDAALLVGDLFIFQAFRSLALCESGIPADRIVRALGITAQSCVDLCLGQALEGHLLQNCSATEEHYQEVVRGKTGSLFRAACQTGAVLGGATCAEEVALRNYGETVGVAFQITDDVLAYSGDEAATGKSGVSDLRNRRVTLPIIYALTSAPSAEADFVQSVISGSCSDQDIMSDYRKMQAILESSGALARARSVATELIDQALRQLEIYRHRQPARRFVGQPSGHYVGSPDPQAVSV